MGDRRAIALVFAAVALAACGGDDDAASDTTKAATTTRESTSTTLLTTRTLAATPTTAALPETAAETTEPTHADQLARRSQDYFAQLSEQEISEVGGEACAKELATVVAAADLFTEDMGVEPSSVNDMYDQGWLVDPLALYEPDEQGSIRPLPGSGCTDVFAPGVCHDDAVDVTEAQLAYLDTNPGATEPTQADLVAAGLLNEASTIVDLVGGIVVAMSGGRCDGVEWTIDWQSHCRADNKTLEVAQEAYNYQYGPDTTPTEQDLVDGGLLREVSHLLDIVDGAIVAVPGRPCDGVDLGV